MNTAAKTIDIGTTLDRSGLLQAYRIMKMIREFEERLHIEFATGEIPGFVHLYAGEEAIATAFCMNLDNRDKITSTHRGHGHCIAKGCDVRGMMAEIYGKKTGLCAGKGGSMHIADLAKGMLGANGIVGGGPPLACGAALSELYYLRCCISFLLPHTVRSHSELFELPGRSPIVAFSDGVA